MAYSEDNARKLLDKAGVFFPVDEYDDPKLGQVLNMNDTWGWACADGEDVSDEELPRVAELFYRYGWCGLLYWVSERNEKKRSEFEDVNRFVAFVRAEESIRLEIPGSSKRAYAKREYVIGAPDGE
jgi:hypothetical protein